MAAQSTGMLSQVQAFFKIPTVKSGLTSCVVMAVGDITCQSITNGSILRSSTVNKEKARRQSDMEDKAVAHMKILDQDGKLASASPEINMAEEGRQGINYDPARTARFALIGLTLHGPYFLHGFRWLDAQFGAAPTLQTALVKSIAGQATIFPIYVGLFFAYMGLLEGKRGEEVVQKVKRSFPPTFKTGCVFWPTANIFNFMFVPPTSRVLYVNGAGLIWNTYLSWTNTETSSLPRN